MTTRSVGWVGPPDPTIRPAARTLARHVPPPYEPNLADLATSAWLDHLPGPAPRVAQESLGVRAGLRPAWWMPSALRDVGVDAQSLVAETTGVELEFQPADAEAFTRGSSAACSATCPAATTHPLFPDHRWSCARCTTTSRSGGRRATRFARGPTRRPGRRCASGMTGEPQSAGHVRYDRRQGRSDDAIAPGVPVPGVVPRHVLRDAFGKGATATCADRPRRGRAGRAPNSRSRSNAPTASFPPAPTRSAPARPPGLKIAAFRGTRTTAILCDATGTMLPVFDRAATLVLKLANWTSPGRMRALPSRSSAATTPHPSSLTRSPRRRRTSSAPRRGS